MQDQGPAEASTSKPQAPEGYEEIGESIGRLVAEGAKSIRWAISIGKMFDYTSAVVRSWVEFYAEQHREELRREALRKARVQRKIQRKIKKAQKMSREAGKNLECG